MSAIRTYYLRGIDITDPKNFDNIIDKITPKDVQKFTKKLFKGADVVLDVYSGGQIEQFMSEKIGEERNRSSPIFSDIAQTTIHEGSQRRFPSVYFQRFLCLAI